MTHASAGGKDFLASLNPDSLQTVTAYAAEPQGHSGTPGFRPYI